MTAIRSCALPGQRHDELPAGAYACPSCQRGLVRRLADVESYLDVLHVIGLAPLRSGDHGPVSQQYESREPIRLDVFAMLDWRTELNGSSGAVNPDGIDDDVVDELPNVWADLDGWSAIVREEHPDHPRGSGPWFLRAWCSWCVTQPWIDELEQDIARVHSALRAACKDQPQRPVGDCKCGGQLFRRSDDPVDPRLRCSACQTTYDGFELVKMRSAS